MKTTGLFLSGIFLIASITLTAQDYGKLIRIAENFYQEGDYQASAAAYQRAFGVEEEPSAGDLYNSACSHALSGQRDAAVDYLNRSVVAGWIELAWTQQDKDLETLHDHPGWEEVIAAMQAAKAEAEKDFDQELIEELKEIMELDQKYRRQMRDVQEKYGHDSEEMMALWNKQMIADSICLERVEAIIAEHGYPGRSLVGSQYDVAFFVIQHAPHAAQEQYLPLLTQAADAGELDKSSLALLIDRVRMGNDEPQLYGSQLRMNQETGQWELYDLADPAEVDMRRAEMGLEPLADYLARFGLEYDRD
jgi:tetratricopeptide (TPR) repeat protein